MVGENRTFPSGNYTLPAWESFKYALISVDMLMVLPICFGNGLVLLAYKTTQKLQKTSNMMLVNLSCADLLTGVIVIPWMCFDYYFTSGYSHGKVTCISFFIACHVPLGVSGLTMFFIALLRFLAVLHPLKHKAFVTKSRMRVVIGLIWAYMTSLVVTFVVFGNSYDDSGGYCNFFAVLPLSYVMTVAMHMATVGTAAAIMYLYIGIKVVQRGRVIRKMSAGQWGSRVKLNQEVTSTTSPGKDGRNMLRSHSSVSKSSSISYHETSTCDSSPFYCDRRYDINGVPTKSEMALYNFIKEVKQQPKSKDLRDKVASVNRHCKTIKMLSTVLACFYICWVPFMVKMIIGMTLDAEPEGLQIFEEFASSALYMNSFLNPCIYAGMNMSFRSAFLKVLHVEVKPYREKISKTDSPKQSSTA